MSQSRVILENLSPEIDAGRFHIKRVVGEILTIEIDLFADGHDVVNGCLLVRPEGSSTWERFPLRHINNDRWTGSSTPLAQTGFYEYTVRGWVDYALNWQHGIEKKIKQGIDVAVELLDGIQYLDALLENALEEKEIKAVKKWKKQFKDPKSYKKAIEAAVSEELETLFHAWPEERYAVEYPVRKVYVDPKKAEFSAWYELFPRSTSTEPGRHGIFKDVEKLLPRIQEFGFDVLYMPPIHPIGRAHRKGKNNAVTAKPGEPGSCWAVGAEEGGHTEILSDLGTLEDFKHLIGAAADHGLEIAMDIAFQAAPEHPWVKEHPSWFRWRPDGTVQYAENPPKKYQDILPIYFETEDWENLWAALRDVFIYWAEQGVRIFRVDNPHTKPFDFWEWCIAEVKKSCPDTIFLAEAFTRPKVMHQLAKGGFNQSYTYYTWRNTKAELIEYMTELTQGPGRNYFRPNFWPNTPDINPWNLQSGHEPIFLTRYFMAATLSSNYGMYGPVYEYLVHEANPGKEEYWDSEKYEVRHWDWEKRNKLTHVITKVNQIRKENPALQTTWNFELCKIENENLFAWFKQDTTGKNNLLFVVNLDPFYTQSGWVQVPLDKVGLHPGQEFQVHDLISGNSYNWNKEWNFVELNPFALPFHLFRIEK